MSFAFTVYDLNTGEPLGGGHYPEISGEAGFVAANVEFERHYPEREIHVVEITAEQYVAEGGSERRTEISE